MKLENQPQAVQAVQAVQAQHASTGLMSPREFDSLLNGSAKALNTSILGAKVAFLALSFILFLLVIEFTRKSHITSTIIFASKTRGYFAKSSVDQTRKLLLSP